MRRLTFLETAKDDLASIASHIAEASDSAVAAESFVAKIVAECGRIARLPGTLGRSRPEIRADLRSFPFGRYVVFFRYQTDGFEVVNVLHSARDLDAYFGTKGDW